MDFKLYSISQSGLFFPKFEIEHNGEIVATVKKKGIGPFSAYVFYSSLGIPYMKIKRKTAFFKFKFEIQLNGVWYADVSQDKGFGKNHFRLDSAHDSYNVEGNIFMKDFTVLDGNEEIAKISRKSFKRKDKYGVAMKGTANENLILAITIVFEFIRRIRKARNSG